MKKSFKIITFASLSGMLALSGLIFSANKFERKNTIKTEICNYKLEKSSKNNTKNDVSLKFFNLTNKEVENDEKTSLNANFDISSTDDNEIGPKKASKNSNETIFDTNLEEIKNFSNEEDNLNEQLPILNQDTDNANTNSKTNSFAFDEEILPNDAKLDLSSSSLEPDNLQIDNAENETKTSVDENSDDKNSVSFEIENTVYEEEIVDTDDEDDVLEDSEIENENIFEEVSQTYSSIIAELSKTKQQLVELNEKLDNSNFETDKFSELASQIYDYEKLLREIKLVQSEINSKLSIEGENSFLNYYLREQNLKILSLQNAYNSLLATTNSMNYISHPFFNQNANVYGYYYTMQPKIDIETENDENLDDTSNTKDESLTENNSAENSSAKNDLADDNFAENSALKEQTTKKTTTSKFAPNIDSYGPTRRNIDTFFNTALLDDNMFNGYNYGFNGYGVPYMNYPNGYFNNANFNSNNMNFANANKQNSNTTNQVATKDLTPPEQANPNRKKFAKNIDSYKDKSLTANINTMGGTKFHDYLKAKISNWFKLDQNINNEANNYVDKFIEENESKNLNEIQDEAIKKAKEKTEKVKDSIKKKATKKVMPNLK